jgi:hypothetical protein
MLGTQYQATCDANCHFTSLSDLCPGRTSDSKAVYASQAIHIVSPKFYHSGSSVHGKFSAEKSLAKSAMMVIKKSGVTWTLLHFILHYIEALLTLHY